MKPSYLRKIDTGECFAYSDYLIARGDMVPWTGPLPWEAKAPAKPAIIIPEEPKEPAAQEEKKEEAKEEFKCESCGFVAKNAFGLKSHMKKHA